MGTHVPILLGVAESAEASTTTSHCPVPTLQECTSPEVLATRSAPVTESMLRTGERLREARLLDPRFLRLPVVLNTVLAVELSSQVQRVELYQTAIGLQPVEEPEGSQYMIVSIATLILY